MAIQFSNDLCCTNVEVLFDKKNHSECICANNWTAKKIIIDRCEKFCFLIWNSKVFGHFHLYCISLTMGQNKYVVNGLFRFE